MITKNRVLAGLLLSAILSSSLFAAVEMDKKDEKRNNGDKSSCMKKDKVQHSMHQKAGMFRMFDELSLTSEQKSKIEQIVSDSRKNFKSSDEAFTKDSFDKTKYVQIMSEKRDNMIKSEAEIIEKTYVILTAKQKEQLKVLMDLRKEKMNKRL